MCRKWNQYLLFFVVLSSYIKLYHYAEIKSSSPSLNFWPSKMVLNIIYLVPLAGMLWNAQEKKIHFPKLSDLFYYMQMIFSFFTDTVKFIWSKLSIYKIFSNFNFFSVKEVFPLLVKVIYSAPNNHNLSLLFLRIALLIVLYIFK